MTQKSIKDRLENWSRWARYIEQRGYDSMTGAVVDRMRRAALGNVWCGVSARPDIDEADALRVESAWRTLNMRNRDMLLWTYINNARPEVVCRKLGIAARPAAVFVEAFDQALSALELALDSLAQRNTIPRNNLNPSLTSDSTKGTALSDEIEALD